jgi:hypothetical protein
MRSSLASVSRNGAASSESATHTRAVGSATTAFSASTTTNETRTSPGSWFWVPGITATSSPGMRHSSSSVAVPGSVDVD